MLLNRRHTKRGRKRLGQQDAHENQPGQEDGAPKLHPRSVQSLEALTLRTIWVP